jgi:ubiquitin C-terminal hydrolase
LEIAQFFAITRFLAWQATLLGAEHMEGDNQFFCSFCQKKTDARRQMKLAFMPPYLCVSLKRFVFDVKVGAICD